MVRNAVANRNHGDQWRVINGLVTVRGRVYIPSSSSLAQEAIAGTHGTSHEGVQKTLHRLRVDFFMLAARAVVQDFVRACDIYQCHRTEQLQPARLLPPLDFLSTVWTDMSMDFIEGLLRVNGKSVILTVVDRFSKAAHFIPLAHPYTATTVAHAFFDSVVRLHGIPSSIVSDRDPVFTSRFWTELFSAAGVKLNSRMASRRRSTRSLSCICAVSLVIGRGIGCTATTPSRRPFTPRHSASSTTGVRRPFVLIPMATFDCRRFSNSSMTEMSSS
jgi:hypothetical protein